MSSPLVSVLMTSYNREKYIGVAIESVLASTYENLELIITDDGSKDATVNIARSYAEKDPRVKVYVNEKNLGDYVNRNKAASYATGKYLKYVDADDYIYPWGLQLLVGMMEQFPEAGYGLCSLMPYEFKWYPFKLTPAETYKYNYFGPSILNKAPLSSIIKREVFEAVGGFSGKRYFGDYEMWHVLALKYDVVLMPDGIVWHRLHEEQESKINRTNPRVEFSYDTAIVNFFKKQTKIPLTEEEKADVIARHKRKMMIIIAKNVLRFRWKLAADLLRMKRKDVYSFKDIQ